MKHFRSRLEHNSVFCESEILSKLPFSIVRNILLFRKKDDIEKIKLFKSISNDSIILYILQKMEHMVYNHHQIIFKEGDEAVGLTMIVRGKVEIYQTQNNSNDSNVKGDHIERKMSKKGARLFRAVSIRTTRGGLQQSSAAPTYVLDVRSDGDMLGYEAFLTNESLRISARPIMQTEAYFLPQHGIDEMGIEQPTVWLLLQREISRQILDIERRLLRRQRLDQKKKIWTKFEELCLNQRQREVTSRYDNEIQAAKNHSRASSVCDDESKIQIKLMPRFGILSMRNKVTHDKLDVAEESYVETKVSDNSKDSSMSTRFKVRPKPSSISIHPLPPISHSRSNSVSNPEMKLQCSSTMKNNSLTRRAPSVELSCTPKVNRRSLGYLTHIIMSDANKSSRNLDSTESGVGIYSDIFNKSNEYSCPMHNQYSKLKSSSSIQDFSSFSSIANSSVPFHPIIEGIGYEMQAMASHHREIKSKAIRRRWSSPQCVVKDWMKPTSHKFKCGCELEKLYNI